VSAFASECDAHNIGYYGEATLMLWPNPTGAGYTRMQRPRHNSLSGIDWSAAGTDRR